MTVLTLSNPGGDLAEIDLNCGAALTRLVLSREDVIKYPLKVDDPGRGYPSALLFPFPNRIKDGRYTFEGNEYRLDINDQETFSAIHGLIAFKPFEIEKQEKASATLLFTYHGEMEGYPFPYEFRITYTLRKSKLDISVIAKNTGEKSMPFGFGWHPYFGISGKPIAEMEVHVPDRNKIELSDRFIPTGDSSFEHEGIIPLKNTILNNVFSVAGKTKKSEVSLKHEDKKLVVSQESGPGKLEYFILYTPPTRDCIAIEPQSCNTNAFNNGDGLQMLKPGEEAKFKISVRVEI